MKIDNDKIENIEVDKPENTETKITLVRPTIEMKQKALEYRKEHFDNGEMVINGSELFDKIECYEEWLKKVYDNTLLETVDPNWVVTDTFFAVDKNQRIVGIIDLRHSLNEFLKDFGNCGYSVRPTERRKGYATEMLHQIISIAKKVGLSKLNISVERDNLPSIKTIVKNGGEYYRSFEYEGKLVDVYKIDL